jgi:hypothetical protein
VIERRSRLERVPAAAGHGRLFVVRMDAGFHGSYERLGAPLKGRAV